MALDITLLVGTATIKKLSVIDDNVDIKILRTSMFNAQEMYIQPILGTRLYKKLQTDIAANTLAGVYQTLMDEYVVMCYVNYVMVDVPFNLVFKYKNKAIDSQNGDNSQAIDRRQLTTLKDEYRFKAEFFKKRLVDFLQENQADYPEYTASFTSDEIQPKKDTYTTPMYLGGGLNDQCKGYFS